MDQLQEELTGQQWREWLEFFALEPTGNVHLDLLWGQLLATLINANKTKGAAVEPADLLPYLKADRPNVEPGLLTDEEIEAANLAWRALAVATGGTVIEADGKKG